MARYGAKAQEKVEKSMHEMKRGKLRSGSGAKVTSRDQAIAIGLSEARKEGGKVPSKKSSSKSGTKKTGAKKASSRPRKASTKKSTAKGSTARRTATKRAASRKTASKKGSAKKK